MVQLGVMQQCDAAHSVMQLSVMQLGVHTARMY